MQQELFPNDEKGLTNHMVEVLLFFANRPNGAQKWDVGNRFWPTANNWKHKSPNLRDIRDAVSYLGGGAVTKLESRGLVKFVRSGKHGTPIYGITPQGMTTLVNEVGKRGLNVN